MQWCQDAKVTWTMEPPTGKSLVSWPKDCKENSNMGKRGVLPNRSSLGKCGDLPSLPRPPHPRFGVLKLTHNFLGGKWTIDALNKCYTWSHLKIFIFASVISVSFAQNRPKSDISGALGPIHYITLKAFAMALGDGTKCKTCFGGPRMILHAHWKNTFPK